MIDPLVAEIFLFEIVDDARQLTPHSMVKLTQNFIVVIVTCKNEDLNEEQNGKIGKILNTYCE